MHSLLAESYKLDHACWSVLAAILSLGRKVALWLGANLRRKAR
jgi:hypothetical protein